MARSLQSIAMITIQSQDRHGVTYPTTQRIAWLIIWFLSSATAQLFVAGCAGLALALLGWLQGWREDLYIITLAALMLLGIETTRYRG